MKSICSKKAFVIVLMIFSASFSCKKKVNHIYWVNIPPNSLFFLIQQNGQPLPDPVLNEITLSYFQNGNEKYISDLEMTTEDYANKGILTTRDIGVVSGSDGIKTFYLNYPDGSHDTLFVNYNHLTSAEADTSACYCLYPFRQIKYNGHVPPIDTSFKDEPVYLFIRKK